MYIGWQSHIQKEQNQSSVCNLTTTDRQPRDKYIDQSYASVYSRYDFANAYNHVHLSVFIITFNNGQTPNTSPRGQVLSTLAILINA